MPDDPLLTITAAPLTAAAWAPYGWVPRPDTDPADGEHTLHFEWDDAHLNTIEHTPDEIESTAAGLRCAVLYRHETHTQVLSPLDAASVVSSAHSSACGSHASRQGCPLIDRVSWRTRPGVERR